MKETSVYLDDYEFNCTVTYYVNQPAQGKWADSDWDCYGYEEIEFDVDSVFVYNDEGDLVEILDKGEKDSIISEYVDRIEDKILEEIREEVEEDIDYPEPLDYYDGY